MCMSSGLNFSAEESRSCCWPYENAPFYYVDISRYVIAGRALTNHMLATLVSQMQWRPLVEAMTIQSVLLLEVPVLH